MNLKNILKVVKNNQNFAKKNQLMTKLSKKTIDVFGQKSKKNK